MPRCEDYPCCGHEAGACPDSEGRFPCASCDTLLPAGNRSSLCDSCLSRPEDSDPDYIPFED